MVEIYNSFMNKKDSQEIKGNANRKLFSGQSNKTCPYCGQSSIPFKQGVCICGKQVSEIQYVKNPKKFAKVQYYSYKDSDHASTV